MDRGNEICGKGGLQEMQVRQKRRGAGKGGCRKARMQEKRNA